MKKWAERVLSVCTALAMVGGFGAIQNIMNEGEAVPQVSAYEEEIYTTNAPLNVDIQTKIQMVGFEPYVAERPNTNANLSDGHGIFKFKLDLSCSSFCYNIGDKEAIYQAIDFEKYLSVSSRHEDIVSVSLLSYDVKTHIGEIDVEFHRAGETEITVNLASEDGYYWNEEYKQSAWYDWSKAQNSMEIRINDYTSTSQIATTTTRETTTTYTENTEATSRATTTTKATTTTYMVNTETTSRATTTKATVATTDTGCTEPNDETTKATTTTKAVSTTATTTTTEMIGFESLHYKPYITGCEKSGVFEVGKNETVDFLLACRSDDGAPPDSAFYFHPELQVTVQNPEIAKVTADYGTYFSFSNFNSREYQCSGKMEIEPLSRYNCCYSFPSLL